MANEGLEALFKNWLREHGGIVLKVARAYTVTAEECEDLGQEILLQVWRSLPQFEGKSSPHTWIYRVALNTALGWHRKERHRRERQRPILDAEEWATSGPDAAQQAHQREAVARLYGAIQKLSRADAALVLLYLEDLSYREMAEVLGISEGNVGVKLSRAKKALGELLKEAVHES